MLVRVWTRLGHARGSDMAVPRNFLLDNIGATNCQHHGHDFLDFKLAKILSLSVQLISRLYESINNNAILKWQYKSHLLLFHCTKVIWWHSG